MYPIHKGNIVIPYNSDSYFSYNAAVASKLANTVHTGVSGKKTHLKYAELVNESGGAITVGLGPILTASKWIAGQWDDSATGAEFLDDTTDAQDADANDFALAVASTNNDGYVIAATELFSTIRITVGTATSGGSPVWEYTYWNGSSWATLTLTDTPAYSAADTHLTFVPPSAWTATVAAESGIPAGYYAIRARATTAPATTAPLASVIYVSHAFKWMKKPVADTASGLWNPASAVLTLNGAGESLVAYFGTADAENRVMLIGDDA